MHAVVLLHSACAEYIVFILAYISTRLPSISVNTRGNLLSFLWSHAINNTYNAVQNIVRLHRPVPRSPAAYRAIEENVMGNRAQPQCCRDELK